MILIFSNCFFVYHKAVDRYPLRLNGSQDSYSGELQVFVNDSWGAFCYNGFSFTTAKLVCKTLGFKTTESIYRINITDTDTPLAVDYVYCYGRRDSFYNCSWNFHSDDEPYHYCWNNDTVGVVCSDGEHIYVYHKSKPQYDITVVCFMWPDFLRIL